MNRVSIETVKYRSIRKGRYYFSPSTLKFFNSKPGPAFQTDDGSIVAFVDTICEDPGRTPEIFKVRVMDWDSGSVRPGSAEYPTGPMAVEGAKDIIRSYNDAVQGA